MSYQNVSPKRAVLDWMETPAQRGAQIAFEHYRARLNRIFDVGSDELIFTKAGCLSLTVSSPFERLTTFACYCGHGVDA